MIPVKLKALKLPLLPEMGRGGCGFDIHRLQ